MDIGIHNKNKNTNVLLFFFILKIIVILVERKIHTIIRNKINDQIFMIAYISTLSMHPIQKGTFEKFIE